MKFQFLAALIATTVSAGPLLKHEHVDQCPSGYSPSVYYITITPTPIPEPTTTTTITSTSSSSVVVTLSLTPVVSSESSTTAGESAPFVSTSTPTAAPETPIPETTPAPIPVTTASEAPTVQDPVPATTAPIEEPTSSTSAAQAANTSPASVSGSAGSDGSATHYEGNVSGGTCSFAGYKLPSNIFGTALSVDAWDDASKCGACVAIKGPSGKTIKAMVRSVPALPEHPDRRTYI